MRYIILFLIFLSGCAVITRQQEGLLHHQAPVTKYVLFDKSYHSLREQLGKTVVLSFWDAHCSHCKKTMPQVGRIADAFQNDSEVFFLGININDQKSEEDVKDAIASLSLGSMTHAFSGNDVLDEAYRAFNGETVPLIVLIDKKGVVRWIGDDPEVLRVELLKLIKIA